ncbi:MAG: alkylation response protein AidB-like acyl-CoA dehydrogenase [Myxococcota bacterium]|jgi:alkylation response protein AidB-like acyl-CoA dehydrogenase
MANFYKDNDDLRWYVDHGIDWAPLVEMTEYLYRAEDGFKNADEAVDFYRDILDLMGDFVGEKVAPYSAEMDREGVRFEDGEAHLSKRSDKIFKAIKQLEIHGMCLPRELGGQNCPVLVYMLNSEMFARADVSAMTHHGFHGGMAMAMLVFSMREGTTTFDVEKAKILKTRFAKEIEEIRRGVAWGCMDITEPGAGSDMASLRATGTLDEKGEWRVNGQKIFITSGHGKYHFVIARTEETDPDDPFAGLEGLSMFLVPTYEDSKKGRKRIVAIDRIEEKLGHHGSATCTLNFDNAPAQLIGRRGEGFKYMLTLMNNARVGVGFESLGLCEAAYRLALDYAAERRSMGKSIDQHEMIADYLDQIQNEIQCIRALAVKSGFHEEMSQKISILKMTGVEGKGAASDRAAYYAAQEGRHKRASRRLTPLLKYIAAEKAVEHARLAVQIHGGNGYTKDYGAEQLLRDAMVMPIYEGTSQIQALMVMKDTLGAIIKRPQAFVRKLAQTRWRSLSARDPLERRLARLQTISLSTQQHLMTRTAVDKYRSLQGKPIGEWPDRFLKDWSPKRDFAFAMLHAERLTQILVDEAIAEVLLEQCIRDDGRRDILERHLERAEPRARFLHDQITTTGDRLLRKLKGNQSQDAAAPNRAKKAS